jgi:hypothetical protein
MIGFLFALSNRARNPNDIIAKLGVLISVADFR